MVLDLLFCIIFANCSLYFFVKHEDNHTCDVYVGVSSKADKIANYNFFIFTEVLNTWITNIKDDNLKSKFECTINKGLPLNLIDKKDYEKTRKLALETKEETYRSDFINSVRYYKAQFNIHDFKCFYFDVIFTEKENASISWAHSQIYYCENGIFFKKLDFWGKKSLDVSGKILDLFVKCPKFFFQENNIYNFDDVLSETSELETKILKDKNLNIGFIEQTTNEDLKDASRKCDFKLHSKNNNTRQQKNDDNFISDNVFIKQETNNVINLKNAKSYPYRYSSEYFTKFTSESVLGNFLYVIVLFYPAFLSGLYSTGI
ncbi:putative SP-containing protein [Vairimorpha necatrix]|uniref:SP-containing protein n=1 Tax=Vairimorpha necatrix TaxID=6039 RepID=A0AAX4JER7_9MICR